MAVLAGVVGLKIPPEGRLAVHPLEKLLGLLGAVEATGILDLTRRKLVRRVVLEKGRVQALVSNAREDRLLEWLLLKEAIRPLSPAEMAELQEAAQGRPLVAEVLVVRGLIGLEALPECQRQHARELLAETAAWGDATFQVRPGKVSIGSEPPLNWPAQAASLSLVREWKPVPAALPEWVVATAGGEILRELPLLDLERDFLAACCAPAATPQVRERLGGCGAGEFQDAAARLSRAGLLVESQPGAEAESPAEPTEVDQASLGKFLEAARAENLHALLGVGLRESAGEVRKAYYRTVRRFHPDRFRQGPLAAYYKQVEEAFRLVHEALAVLTDPAAAARWEKRRAPVGPAPAPTGVPPDILDKLKAMISDGRRAEALQALEQGLKIDPGRKDLELASWLLVASNPRRRAEAIGKLTELARQAPPAPGAAFALGLALRKAGQPGAAQAWLVSASKGPAEDLFARAARGDNAALRELRADPFWNPLLSA